MRPQVAVISSYDLSRERTAVAAGSVPRHRLLGPAYFEDLGYRPLYFCWPGWVPRTLRRPPAWRVLQAVWLVANQRRCVAVLCTTEAAAPPVLAFRRLGLLRRRVVVVGIALLQPANSRLLRRWLLGWFFRGADAVVVLASSQVESTVSQFRLRSGVVTSLAFGVDTAFFAPVGGGGCGPDVLMVGTNAGKDVATLLRALPPKTSCLIVTDAINIRAAEAHGVPEGVELRRDVPILELRGLYAAAKHVVIPLRDSPISSGQTVLLENLVSGNRVVISDVAGVRDYVRGSDVVLVPPGDAEALRRVLLRPPRQADPELVANARERFDAARYAEDLLRLLDPPDDVPP